MGGNSIPARQEPEYLPRFQIQNFGEETIPSLLNWENIAFCLRLLWRTNKLI